MSAFMVEDKTINRVTSWVFQQRTTDYTRRELAKLGLTDEAALGQAMFGLNIRGVNDRYPDHEADDFRPLDYTTTYELASRLQVLKSLSCWLYQCSEGDVPDDPLYKMMEECKHALMSELIHELPGWEAAEWG